MRVTTQERERLTYDDFLRFPDDGLRHEIIDGVHYVTAAPNLRHQTLLGRLYLSLGTWVEDRPERGLVFIAPFDVVFSFHDVVEPDLALVTADQLAILNEQNVKGAPALVVEVLSPSTRARDRRLKLDLYARSGVQEYWMVDPDGDTVTVHRRGLDQALSEVGVLTGREGDTLASPLVPGWSLSVSRLFR